MTFFLSAAVLGLMSGGHCLGMCGPLVLALPVAENNRWLSVFYRVVYNFGRISVYVALGAIVGFSASGMSFRPAQKYLAYISGALLILVSLVQLAPRLKINAFIQLHQAISRILARISPARGVGRMFFLGTANGFLPCGMVAAALVAAMSAGDAIQAILFMLFFGLGTFPLMLAASLFGVYLSSKVRQAISVVGPVYGILLGVLLILRPGLIHPHCH